MQHSNNYDRVNENFESAVKLLQKNLQYLADQDKVSPKFIAIQNRIIRSLIDFQHQTNLLISDLEMDVMELMLKKSSLFDELHDTIEALEAICLIHGIVDFPAWMSKGKNNLVYEAIDLNKRKTIQLPILLIRSIPTKNHDKLFLLFNSKITC